MEHVYGQQRERQDQRHPGIEVEGQGSEHEHGDGRSHPGPAVAVYEPGAEPVVVVYGSLLSWFPATAVLPLLQA